MKRAISISTASVFKKLKTSRPDDSSSEESSDTESILSIQNKSTDYANDTEDTSASYVDDDEMERRFCQRKYVLSSSEESEIQEIADLGAAVASAVLDKNFDIGLADSSEECSTSPTSNSDVDPGLPRCDYIDFEKCLICKSSQKDISYPYCNRCYKFKKTFFPPRPSGRKRKGRKKQSGSESVKEISSQDSGCSSSSQLTIDLNMSKNSPNTTSSKSDDNLCEICFEKNRNGLFIHGKSCHLYGCYSCAKKAWWATKACPLCRKKVAQVIKFL